MGYHGYGIQARFKDCPTCGKSFKVHACVEKRGGGKYCSRPCRQYTGSGNPKWRGGRIYEPDGRLMIYAPEHPNATMNGGKYIYEYRLIASRMLGRPLTDEEIVHHKNGDHTDNSPSNLEVMTQSEHARIHMLERYGHGI